MLHRDLRLAQRGVNMSCNEGRRNMIRKPCWGALASILMGLALVTGCASTPQNPVNPQLTTVTSIAPFFQTAYLNQPYVSPFSVTVTTNGTPAPGVVVTFVAPSTGAGGTFANGTNSTTATTDSTGLATSSAFTADGTVGTFVVIASAQGTQSTTTFSLSNTTVPSAMSATGGTPQSATVTKAFGSALVATVVDGGGNPVAGLQVTFTAPSTGASGIFGNSNSGVIIVMTDSNGKANSGTFTANDTVGGPYTVSASVPGVSGTTDFSLTNTN